MYVWDDLTGTNNLSDREQVLQGMKECSYTKRKLPW